MKKYIFVFLFLSQNVKASGITGSSGNELLYVYLILLGILLSLLGISYLLKLGMRKYKNWKLHKDYPEMEDLF